jgi:hypothetical protein
MISNIEKRREYARNYAREWRRKNPDKVKEVNRSDKNKIRQARYRATHKHIDRKPYMDKYNKDYYQKNRESNISRAIKFKQDNPERVRETTRLWYKNGGMRKGTNARLALDIRRRINTALKYNYKSSSTEVLLGATIAEVKIHLEKQFKPGMSWDNHTHRGWHIDHIVPVSSFDLSRDEEQKKAFHYTNLQPLFAIDNLKKSNRIII